MLDLKFGDRVNCNKKLYRCRIWDAKSSRNMRLWKETEKTIKNGIFIGMRTVSNGYIEWMYEGGNVYYPIEYIKVAQVAPGPNSKPVYVPINELEHA